MLPCLIDRLKPLLEIGSEVLPKIFLSAKIDLYYKVRVDPFYLNLSYGFS